MNNSINNQQYSPNFGMALVIAKKAEPFIESLPSAERKYLHELGKRIKGSRNDINILEECLEHLRTLKDTWKEIMKINKEKKNAK